MTTISLTIFNSVSTAYISIPDQQVTASWTEIIDLLSQHHDIESKDEGMLFNLVKFKSIGDASAELGRSKIYSAGEWLGEYKYHENTVRRCKSNVIGISGIVLDVDNSLSIEGVIDMLDGVEYLLYTTFSHTPEKNKFRVVIPFSQLLESKDIAGRQKSIIQTFPGVDHSSFSVSQCFYFHSGKNNSIVHHNTGIIINPYDFEEDLTTPIIETAPQLYPTQITQIQQQRYSDAVKASLMTCSGLRYRTDMYGGVLMLVSICKSVNMSFSEFASIATHISDSDSSVRNSNVLKDCWNSWSGNKITKEKRDRFITSHHGKPLKIERLHYTEVKQALYDKYVKGKQND